MRGMLAFLSEHMALALGGLALAAVVVAGYVALTLWRARRVSPTAASLGVDVPPVLAHLTQAADLELSFRRAFRALKAAAGGPGFPYRLPWYLVVGPAGSGKSTMLDTLLLPRRALLQAPGTPLNVLGWHLFDGGVVLDLSGSLTLKDDLSHDDLSWRRLLGLLRRYRPERPVEGVILTLSAADLLAWQDRPADELREVGGALFRRLREAQGRLGVRFPVYVVLTQGDRLPGFSSFVRALPRRFHQDVFGWSNPYALEAAFRPEWVDEALGEVEGRLRHRATEVLASRRTLGEADAVFRFSDVARALAPAARAVLGEVFKESAYHEGFFFRGIYLTGEGPRDEAAEAPDPAPEAEGGEPDAPEAHLFLARLFERKIFPEAGLARGFARGILDRNRTVRWLQIAAALVVLVGVPGVWVRQAQLRQEAEPLEALLHSLRTDLERIGPGSRVRAPSQTGAEAAVLSMLRQMARLDARPFWSVFLPSSWFSDLDEEVTVDLTNGFQGVILPTIRRGIVEWADTLVDPAWAPTLGGRVPLDAGGGPVRSTARFQEYEVLVRYLGEVSQFADAAGRFNRLVGPDPDKMETFSGLFTWYYEENLPAAFFDRAYYYQRALENAREVPVAASDWPGFEDAAARTASEMADRFYVRLRGALEGLSQSMAGAADPAFTASDLRQLSLDVGQVHALLTSSDSAWFTPEGPMVPALQVVLDSFPRTDLFDRDVFVEGFGRGFGEVRRRHLASVAQQMAVLAEALPAAGGEPGAPGPVGGQGAASSLYRVPQLDTLRAALDDLLGRRFMAPLPDLPGDAAPPALAGRPTWNVVPLEEALASFAEYRDFRDGRAASVPAPLRGSVLGAAARALEDHVRLSLSRALTYELGVGKPGRMGMEEDLRARMASFDVAARRLVALLEQDAQLGGTPAGAAVAETIILEAADLLDQVDMLLVQDRLWEPMNGNMAVWRGTGPASLAAFGVPDADALEEYLGRQRSSLRALGQYAAPVLGYLDFQPVAELLRSEGPRLVPSTLELVRKWRGILTALDEYDKKTPGNSLEALDQFIRQDLAVTSLSGCPAPGSLAQGTGRDHFEAVRLRLGRMLVDRCRQLARTAFQDGYDRLARFHAAQLAGRFPFADLSANPTAADAEVGAVRSFLQMYDEVAGSLTGEGAAVVGGLLAGEIPGEFFRQMGQVRDFLGPLLFPAEQGTAGALEVRTTLRTNRASERGADQIVEWRVGVGAAAVGYRGGGGAGTARWGLGDPVSVSLTWASESARRPVADPGRPDLVVEGATATWRYGGPWALLRLVAVHRPEPAALTGVAREDRSTVNLRVVTRSRDGVAEPVDAREGQASVFLRIGAAGAVGGPELMYPDFPVRVPPRGAR